MQDFAARAPRILFVPVSSAKGIGEYMRSLSIAQSLAKGHEDIDIRFVLSEQAPYRHDSPFPYFSCPSSPTKHSRLVNKYIDEFKPDIVVFDASGRAAQLKHCKLREINTVFICQHNKKLKKGLKLTRIINTDEIWVVLPGFAMKTLSFWQKIKLKLVGDFAIKVIGPVFHQLSRQYIEEILAKHNLQANDFILVNSGGGGHVVNGVNAAQEFAKAARMLSKTRREKVVVIYGPNFKGEYLNDPAVLELPQTSPEEFNAILQSCKCALLAGGDALYQGIAYERKIVCCPVSKDQPERISACVDHDFVIDAKLDAMELSNSVDKALNEFTLRNDTKIEDGLRNATDMLLGSVRKLNPES